MHKDEATQLAQTISGMMTEVKPKFVSVSAVVHRADTNTHEDLGILSAYHSNPIIHAMIQLSIFVRGLSRKYGNRTNKQR